MSFIEPSELLWTELSAIAHDEGLVLYDIELGSSDGWGGRVVRVFIDKAEADLTTSASSERVKSEDCSRLCRRLVVYFSVEGERLGVGSEPEIEVSSPGVNRHLRLAEHFASATGQRVKLVFRREPAPGFGVSVRGVLQGPEPKESQGSSDDVEQSRFRLLEEQKQTEVCFALQNVKRAHVDYQFS